MQPSTKYFDIMNGTYRNSPSILITGNATLHQIIFLRSYLNYILKIRYEQKLEIWHDQPFIDRAYIKQLYIYHGRHALYFRPTKLFQNVNKRDEGLRKIYDECMFRKLNASQQVKKIVYIDDCLIASNKPTQAMVEEILDNGGKNSNIQYIAKTISGMPAIDPNLFSQFDIKIATLPLSKKDSVALFNTPEYASRKNEDFVIIGYKNKVEKVPIFNYNPRHHTDKDYLALSKTWTF